MKEPSVHERIAARSSDNEILRVTKRVTRVLKMTYQETRREVNDARKNVLGCPIAIRSWHAVCIVFAGGGSIDGLVHHLRARQTSGNSNSTA